MEDGAPMDTDAPDGLHGDLQRVDTEYNSTQQRSATVSEVLPGLFIHTGAVRDAKKLKAADITHLMCCTESLDPMEAFPAGDFTTNYIPLNEPDGAHDGDVQFLEMMRDAGDFIEEALYENGRVVCFCNDGSRYSYFPQNDKSSLSFHRDNDSTSHTCLSVIGLRSVFSPT